MISEDKLDALHRGGKDRSFDWFIGLGGIGVGFLQNLWQASRAIWAGTVPEAWDFFGAVVCVACAAGAVAKYTEHQSKQTDVDALVKKIKEGSRKIPIS